MKGSIFDKLRRLVQGAKCARKDCKTGGVPKLIPVIAVWKNVLKNHRAACFVFQDQACCGDCFERLRLEDFITEAGKEQFTAAFKKDGKPLPCWDSAELQWRPLA